MIKGILWLTIAFLIVWICAYISHIHTNDWWGHFPLFMTGFWGSAVFAFFGLISFGNKN